MTRTALVIVSCLLWLSGVAYAANAQETRAVLELQVNDVAAGEALVVLRGPDVLIQVTTLENAGVGPFAGQREILAGQEYVSLQSLAPDIKYELDEIALRLVLRANPELLGRRVRRLSTGAPEALVYRSDSSAFLNYALNWTQGSQTSLFTESGVRLGGALLYGTVSTDRQRTVRGVTSVSFDERDSLRRWTLGDSFGYSGPTGGDAWIAGLTVAREFAIDPYFIRYPTLALSTPIAVPSVMEVHVNGRVVSEEAVAPGRLDIQNLPLTVGRNDARIIVRDAFGGTREIQSNFYLTTAALAPGVHDYHYSVGVRREGLGSTSWDYRRPAALMRHRVGLTDKVTVGGRAEFELGRVASAGPLLNLRLPVGEVEAATGLSRSAGAWGRAAHAAFTFTGHTFGGGGSVAVTSRHYATLSEAVAGQEPAVQTSVHGNAALPRGASLTVQHTRTRLHDAGSRWRSSVFSTIPFRRAADFIVSLSRSREEGRTDHEIYAGISLALGGGSANVAHVHDRRGSRVALDTQRSLPAGVGYGYQVRAETGGEGQGNMSGVFRYQGNHGRYEVRQDYVGGKPATSATIAGGIVAIGGSMFATRPVRESFALIRVPDVEGVRAFSSNQEVGRTDSNGNVLIPDLQPYYGNILNIADSDVPLDYEVEGARMTLAPPFRGGAIALFAVRAINRITGTLKVIEAGVERVPAYGKLTVTADGQYFSSPVGSDGGFYLENLGPGRYPARVTDKKASCEFEIEIPSGGPAIELGAQRCTVEEHRQP